MSSQGNNIHFVCEHCGRTVQVPARFGGRKGRCPFCGAVVTIPLASQAGTPKSRRRDADAAVILDARQPRGTAPAASAPPPPPPPPPSEDLTIEELEASEETDEMPALHDPSNEKTTIVQAPPAQTQPHIFQSTMNAKTRRHMMLLALAITAAITAGCAIIFALRHHP